MHKCYKIFGSSYEEICRHLLLLLYMLKLDAETIMSTHLYAKNVYYHPTLSPVGSIYSQLVWNIEYYQFDGYNHSYKATYQEV